MYTLLEAQSLPERLVGAETRLLGAYASRVPAAFVIPPGYQEDFYRHNNLPAQLSALFASIRPQRIDEDALETLCVQAQGLLRGCALLDDSVQQLQRALHQSGLESGTVHLRRPGARVCELAQTRPPGAEVLFALKRLWAADWGFGAVLSRLDDEGSVALEAAPVLVLRGEPGQPDAGLAAEIGVSGAWVNAQGLVGLAS
ncbi:hypothetical protein [Deinococcus sp.]|uniref:hypothetical protein n=1 Tax=Deinococcus sp. TaxID=47478 RepID=UPI003CC6B44F